MGQQQLLLLVLGIVIVGLAVVVGIQAFNENQQKSEVDRFTEQGVAMAGDLIAYYMKPAATGGGGQDAASLNAVTVADLGYEQNLSDSWGGFTRTGTRSQGSDRLLAQSATHPFFHLHPFPWYEGMTRVEVHVFGPDPQCIVARNDDWVAGGTWSDGKGEFVAPDNPNPAACSW